MAKKRRKNRTSPTFGPKKFGAAVRRCLQERGVLVMARPHQTFPWFVVRLEQWLEGETQGADIRVASVRTRNLLRKVSLDVLQILFSIRQRDKRLVAPESLVPCVRDLIPSPDIAAQLMCILKEECSAYVSRTRWAELDDIPAVIEWKEKRSPNRKREELPDPSQLAWAGVNRLPSDKVEISCRLQSHIRKMVADAAGEFGLSQSAWLERLVVLQLREQGYEAKIMRRHKRSHTDTSIRRRPRRRALPQPDKSHDVSANRADKSTTVRVNKSLADAVDAARPASQDRSRWLHVAIWAYFRSEEALPARDMSSEPLTESYSVRFDPEYFAKLEEFIEKSGMTKSEWLRRVMRWRLKNLEKS